MIKITIDVGERTARHLDYPHTFYYGCLEENIVMKKVQNEIHKKLKTSSKAS